MSDHTERIIVPPREENPRVPSVIQAAIDILSQSPADFLCDHGNATNAPVSSCTHGETGHMCTGTYKTFAAEHCPYCQRKPYHPNGVCGDSTCGICKY